MKESFEIGDEIQGNLQGGVMIEPIGIVICWNEQKNYGVYTNDSQKGSNMSGDQMCKACGLQHQHGWYFSKGAKIITKAFSLTEKQQEIINSTQNKFDIIKKELNI